MKFARFFAIFWFFAAAPVFAADSSVLKELYVYPSFQYFTWEEFDDEGRILKETGPLFGAGAAVVLGGPRLGADSSLMFKGKGELFGGVVDYDGHTIIDRQPIKTDVTYFGTKAEADLGLRLPSGNLFIEPFGGLGIRWWLRDVGYQEDWFSAYARIGLRGGYAVEKDIRIFVEAGAKYPFYTENDADFPGVGHVTVEPGGEWSAFAEIGFQYKRFRPSFFYEGFRYSASPSVPVVSAVDPRITGLLQPRSESDIFGINIAYVFR